MDNILKKYAKSIEEQYLTRDAGEHSYRLTLSQFFNDIDSEINVTNEPSRRNGNAPDMVIKRENNDICFVETKDLGVDLNKLTKNDLDQKSRYLDSFTNLIYTNYLDWQFYHKSVLLSSLSVGKISNDRIELISDPNDKMNRNNDLLRMLRVFFNFDAEKITDSSILASRLADKAHVIKNAMVTSLKNKSDISINKQYNAFKKYLVSEISEEYFADIYAETITYGMFTAKLHQTDSSEFDRSKASDLIPESNPFLKNLFKEISSKNLDNRVSLTIDQLAKVLNSCNLNQLIEGFGSKTQQTDPIIHFYETFLSEYNPQKKKDCGVFYTPDPIVKFIVRAVDDILQTEFGLAGGLADKKIGKTKITKQPIDKVQILDPAIGTGSFLAETIKVIANKVKKESSSAEYREDYVRDHLLKRINGFEVLMAPYAICHLNLQRVINREFEIDIGMGISDRLSVYLTNSLEDLDVDQAEFPFLEWLQEEIEGAKEIKQDNPIMCVIGNPPYSEKTDAPKEKTLMHGLLQEYRKEPPDSDKIRIKLQEDNPRSLNDLYVQFIRASSEWIKQTGEGVLAFITNHGFIDNATFRGMRWHLLDLFDKIWILDLHGHARRESKTERDENVFNIQQGVSIIIAVKKKNGDGSLATIFRGDLWGTRESKYQILEKCKINDDLFKEINPIPNHYIFSSQDHSVFESYELGFSIKDFMKTNSNGIVTARNEFTIDINRNFLIDRLRDFTQIDEEEARIKYNLGADSSEWKVAAAKKDVGNFDESKLIEIEFRPFDIRWTYYTGKSLGLMCRPREIMKNMIYGENMALIFSRMSSNPESPVHVFVTNFIYDKRGVWDNKGGSQLAPLYLYVDEKDSESNKSPKFEWKDDNSKLFRKVNFDPEIKQKIELSASHPEFGIPDELNIFDYIYGILNCPGYIEKYADFLRSDYPKIPYPQSPAEFWDISESGGQLRKLHLMDEEVIGELIHDFRNVKSRIVGKKYPVYNEGKIWINETDYFDNVSASVWNTIIAGYQPAHRWLMDRRGMKLSPLDIEHYKKILKILEETVYITKSIKLEMM